MQAHPQSSSAARLVPSPAISSLAPQLSPTGPQGGLEPAGILSPVAGSQPAPGQDSCPLSEGAGLAHDAGNLLHALGLYCDLLQRPGVLQPEHMHYATELRQISARSSTMLLRLLKDFVPAQAAAVSSAPSRFAPQPERQVETQSLGTRNQMLPPSQPAAARPCVNPAEVLHGQSALLQRLATPWATISVATQDPLPGLEFSAEILERITVNLVLNAAEALRSAAEAREGSNAPRLLSPAEPEAAKVVKRGRIRVSLRMTDGRLRLSVEDNGPGMPAAVAAAFLRPTPLPAGAARGLGHRIVHELAGATGGQISVHVRPGTGTTLSLDWPVKLATTSPRSNGPALRLVSTQRPSADIAARSQRSRTHHGGSEAC